MSEEMTTEETIRQLGFDLSAAQKWANGGKIEVWVHRYLRSGIGGSTNPQFSDGLQLARRWWNGPVEVALADLTPAVGSDPAREYVVEADHWQAITGRMAAALTDVQALPPLIVEYRAGELSVRDGNTRMGAMERLGWTTCWVVIWYNSEEDYLQHSAKLFNQ